MKTNYKPFDCSLEEYEHLIYGRAYWDNLCHQYSRTTEEEKLVHLAGFVKKGGDLYALLEEYADGRDEMYRECIQRVILHHIGKMMLPDYYKPMNETTLRIKRLDKEELVKLLTETLKRCVHLSSYIDSDGSVKDCWEITVDTRTDILEAIEDEHWKNHPDEDLSSYLLKSDFWDRKSLW